MYNYVKFRRMIERRIVGRVIRDLLAAGYKLWIDHEGEDARIDIKDANTKTMDEVFACDEERVYVEYADGSRAGWVYFIYGNDGFDVISDYTTNLEPVIEPCMDYANQLEVRYA